MRICNAVITAVEQFITIFVEIFRTVVETVCGWVTSAIRTVVEVSRRVCDWMPWPLDAICGWVTDLVEVITEVTEWICEEVVSRVIDIVEWIIRYVFYIVHWICWVADLPLRILDLLVCMIGIHLPRTLHVCVKILTDAAGAPATTRESVDEILKRAADLLKQCQINVCVDSIEMVRKPDLLSGVECGISQMASSAFHWFDRHACRSTPLSTTQPLTLYFVDSLAAANACSIPRTTYVILTDGANGASVVHEFGHLSDLTHRDDPRNIMFAPPSDTKDQLTEWQCCMMRSSEFVSATHKCEPLPSLAERFQEFSRRRAARRAK